ncbi:hypothetical protein GQ457_14G021410 [Hibiscus cannabinus]
MDSYPQREIQKPGTSLENERESEIVGQEALGTHGSVEPGSIEETIGGNETLNHCVAEKNIGLFGLVEDKASVAGLAEIEGSFQEEVEKIGVLVKVRAEKRGVNLLEVFDGGKAMEDAALDFCKLCKR